MAKPMDLVTVLLLLGADGLAAALRRETSRLAFRAEANATIMS
jgi:hypothetical protein